MKLACAAAMLVGVVACKGGEKAPPSSSSSPSKPAWVGAKEQAAVDGMVAALDAVGKRMHDAKDCAAGAALLREATPGVRDEAAKMYAVLAAHEGDRELDAWLASTFGPRAKDAIAPISARAVDCEADKDFMAAFAAFPFIKKKGAQ